MYFLAIVGLLSTVISAFYYLRIIKVIYFDEEREKYDTDHSIWLRISLIFSTLLILLYFIFFCYYMIHCWTRKKFWFLKFDWPHSSEI
jgi:NADH:ubiquinone oxidoreductase subunit 2 (subunit N)